MDYKRILVTGGAGFIGSHLVKWLNRVYPRSRVIVLDKITYCGSLSNLEGAEYTFIKGDIADERMVDFVFSKFGPDVVFHLAAETHVDRSIDAPAVFMQTNLIGTWTLLEAARQYKVRRFIHVSTDEVYGSRRTGFFTEEDKLQPSSPYSASKAGSDLLALSYFKTYGLPVIVTRCTNNYGPNQYPEKLIPCFIKRLIEGKKLPLFGDGTGRRDWIWVGDHCSALTTVLERGVPGEVYNIAGGNEHSNLEVTRLLLKLMGKTWKQVARKPERKGHDWRYAVDDSKLKATGWCPKMDFEYGLALTIKEGLCKM